MGVSDEIESTDLPCERKLRVLVIEPRTEAGYVTKKLLESAGHQVEFATNGKKGVELAVTHEPDVVTTSIEVPELDGFEIASELRARLSKKPRLIATTSYAKSEIGDRLKAVGFDYYLAKPFSRESLLTVVEASEGDEVPDELVL